MNAIHGRHCPIENMTMFEIEKKTMPERRGKKYHTALPASFAAFYPKLFPNDQHFIRQSQDNSTESRPVICSYFVIEDCGGSVKL